MFLKTSTVHNPSHICCPGYELVNIKKQRFKPKNKMNLLSVTNCLARPKKLCKNKANSS